MNPFRFWRWLRQTERVDELRAALERVSGDYSELLDDLQDLIRATREENQ
uniref:Uncharacterized protein n=1 Tax=viral metagenome TaxID=1070528 RepID=A0A6M3LXC0_9ZZZZ